MMALDYPYTAIVGDTADGEQVRVEVSVQDEYHLLDESALIQAIRDHVDAREGITRVGADRLAVTVTTLPEA
jgi:hypothetical protein